MKHIITHLIRGEAGKYHEKLTEDLSERFGVFPLHDRIAPHLTFKQWFELDEQGMSALYQRLENFANSHTQSGYSLNGFGNFGKDLIYIDALPSAEMSQNILDLMHTLRQIEGLTFDEFDTGSHLHATIAMGALKPFDYGQIWGYLTTVPQPDFKMQFDNIAVLKRTVDRWVVDRVWELKPTENTA